MTKRIAMVVFLVALGLALTTSNAMAVSSYLTAFTNTYPGSATATTASWSSAGARCNLCHSSGGGTDLNAYGAAWVRAGGSASAFAAINTQNSDGSATTNLEEINAGAQPGWRPGPNNTLYDMFDGTTVTRTAQNPPSTLIGAADPVAAPPPANLPPVLNTIGNKQTFEGTLLTFTASATDPDAGSVLTFSAGNLPTGATLTPAGVFNWTPSFAQGNQSYTVTVTVTDNGSPAQSDSETVTITVNNVNRPPVLGAIGAKTINEGQPLSFTVSATDPDADGVTFTMSGQPTGATLTDNRNGTALFSWTPTSSQGQTAPYSVTITVSDSASPTGTDFETLTITVGNVNQPPVLAPIGARTANVGQLFTFTATATDPDGNALTFAGGSLPAGATVTPAGVLSWTPTAAQAGTSPSMTITVTDNGSPALTDSETFTVTVGAAANRPPVLNPIGAKTGSEGQPLTFTATGSDPDGDPLTFSASGLPGGASLTPAGAYSWTPTFTQSGTSNVTISVSDGKAAPVSEQFTITIGNVNRPPVLSPSPVGTRTVTEGQTLTIAFSATDPDGDTMNFTTANLPSGAALDVTGNGAGTFSWTPATGQAGTYQNVTITVSDGVAPDSEVFTITVNAPAPVNQAPTVNNPGNKTVTTGQLLSFAISGSDPDGNALSYAATGLPSGATLSSAGAFSWTPISAQANTTYTVAVTATDNGSPALTSASQTFTITVNAPAPPVNQAPTVNNPGNKTVTAGNLLSFAITGSDPDGNALSYAATGLPSGASLSTGGAFSWTPTLAQASSTPYSVTVTATDNGSPALTSASQSFTITVQAPAPPPPPPPPPPAGVCTLGVSPLRLSFGSVRVGTTATLATTLSNTGTAACSVSRLAVSGSAFSLASGAPTLPVSVAAGATLDVRVDYKPTTAGTARGAISIASNSSTAPARSVTLTGTGVSVDLDIAAFKPSSEVVLGDREHGQVRIRLAVKNNGRVNQPRNATVVGVQNGQEVYRQERAVSAGAGRQVVVSFGSYTPTVTGDIAWTASIADDNADVDERKALTRVRAAEIDDDDDDDDDEEDDD